MCKRKPRILVVDDDINMVKALKMILEKNANCLEVVTATSVQEADQVMLATADLAGIILDINLAPGLSGEEYATGLRIKGESLGILLMSGQTEHQGKFNFIEKPFNTSQILKTVNTMISTWSIRQDTSQMKRQIAMIKQNFEDFGYHVSTG